MRWPPSCEPLPAVIARGEAAIGFQQVSELIHEPGETFVGTIQAELQPDTIYSAAIGVAASASEAAGALIHLLVSGRATPAI